MLRGTVCRLKNYPPGAQGQGSRGAQLPYLRPVGPSVIPGGSFQQGHLEETCG